MIFARMLSLANAITIARIVMVIALLFVEPLSMAFYSIYLACGISDVLDGYVARKTGTASRIGGRLDTVADLMMTLGVGFLLYPYVWPVLHREMVVWIILVGLVRLLSLLVVQAKYKSFEILHTYGNKATGFLLFTYPFFLPGGHATVFAYIVCVVASLSAIEELVIHLSSRSFQSEKKSIFLD
jgi:CDP-diacylglycerol--glycerol-3-phosphate 3-phosphatidyltransferase